MPKQRMDLRMIKDIIRLKWQSQLSHEQIAMALNVSKGVVSKYLSLASAAGLDWDAACALDERQLTMRLLPRTNTAGSYVEPDWAAVHRELDRKGVTLVLLWQEYQAANAEARTWGYTQFWAHYKDFVQRLKRSMRQHRLAGEKLFIDFAGPTVPLVDGSRAQVFVAAMAASSCVFACATPTQRLEDWVEGIVRALAFYGGVPQLIVPDNPRALIAEPDRYEPRANATVLGHTRDSADVGADAFIALALPPQRTSVALPDIRIELRRGATTVNIHWPTQGGGDCAVWLREWLR